MVRPRPLAAPPLAVQFLELLLSPATGVTLVVRSAPGLGRLTWVLAVIGLLRGIVEGFWYYLMTGRLHELGRMVAEPTWYTRYGGPFLLLNIPSAHFLWLTTALIVYGSGRLLGGTGSFRQVLQVTGVALFSYLLIGLVNYLHLLLPLPSITLNASAFYSPNLGIGQLLTFAWLVAVCYRIQRQVMALPPFAAAMAAPLPVLVSLVLYLGSAGFFFRLVPMLPGDWQPDRWLHLANVSYLATTVALSGAMAWVSRSWLKEGD